MLVIALCVAVIALTLGQIGHSTEDTPNFATQLHQVSRSSEAVLDQGSFLLSLGGIATDVFCCNIAAPLQ